VGNRVLVDDFLTCPYDPDADATAALFDAINTGMIVCGVPGRFYGIDGEVSLPAGAILEDVAFKQLSPHASTGVKTLRGDNVDGLRLTRVKVDRNGDGTGGSVNYAAGIWIKGGKGHRLEDCEVFGSDMGTGIVFQNCTDFEALRLHVHDILYASEELPEDDMAQGIWVSKCQRFTVSGCRVNRIGGVVGGSYRRAFGRMMPIGLGCKSFLVIGNHLSDGDQGIDMTGSVGNQRFTVMGNTIEDVETWGIKLANYNRFGQVIGNNVYRAGSAAYVGSGPTENVDSGSPTPECLPVHVLFEGNGAWDTGFGNTGRGTDEPVGFLLMPGGASNFQDFPRGYRFTNNTAVDNQPVKTQKHGFRNEISYGGPPLNESVNNRASGFVTGGSGFSGWHFPMAAVSKSSQSIPSGVSTDLTFDTERSDGAAMRQPATPGRLFVPRVGFYNIKGKATFAANATGQRILGITLGGTQQLNSRDIQTAQANMVTCRVDEVFYIGDVNIGIGITAFQNSGGSLDITYSELTVLECMPNQAN
jgi:hypothetical protein